MPSIERASRPLRLSTRLLSIRRGSLAHLLAIAVGAIVLSGLGFWVVEPTAHSLGDGLWLAFTTASTVGYGDIVPTSWAAKIFACLVVLVGFAILSLVTAAMAAYWVSTDERTELAILLDLKDCLAALQDEVGRLAKSQSIQPPAALQPKSLHLRNTGRRPDPAVAEANSRSNASDC